MGPEPTAVTSGFKDQDIAILDPLVPLPGVRGTWSQRRGRVIRGTRSSRGEDSGSLCSSACPLPCDNHHMLGGLELYHMDHLRVSGFEWAASCARDLTRPGTL